MSAQNTQRPHLVHICCCSASKFVQGCAFEAVTCQWFADTSNVSVCCVLVTHGLFALVDRDLPGQAHFMHVLHTAGIPVQMP